ncbi:ATP-binding cassette domain-containing protein [Dietzia cinnamea]|uniref:ABC transporter ATP-binding protein n=1 Tax=Dietzia cinnamea TaxID=321318 RepID=UPI0019573C81|nr:ATP-binding cassette domain-containing protein [Dietzia cinnamea]MBM7232079.1 ATP-binding cassette domain-containing protein [Dietzia cinnamea]MCT2138318.1 ATP-binding cassette domain-containing protein [Dietzia cinnamea]
MTLVATGAAFRYPGCSAEALPPTDLTVAAGTITALAGPSGSGKTTLARLLAGLLTPTAGSVIVTEDGTASEVRPRRGRLPGHTALLDQDPAAAADPRLTLRRMIALPGRSRRIAVDVDSLAREVRLEASLLDRRPGEVSGGQLQRACLARALAQQPRYLLADEATAHLDPDAAAVVLEVLRARTDRGLGVLAITHDRDAAAGWADHVVTLR